MSEVLQDLLDTASRNSLKVFTRRAFKELNPSTQYLHNWHIDLICEHLTACYKGDIKRLIINIPPRFMKSITVSSAFPAWLLGNNPSEKIINATYASSLSMLNSVNCKAIVKSDFYKEIFPDTVISDIQDQKQYFKTTKNGHYYATSVGSSVTGFGGGFLIVDDPHNPQQALSKVQREQAITFYEQTLLSRLDDKKKGVIILIMQRLHEDDLTGHLLRNSQDWTHLKIPMIAEKDIQYYFPITKKEKLYKTGEVLHEERMNKKEIEEFTMSSYAFAGQYQQEPAPLGGGLIKNDWLLYYNFLPEGKTKIVQSWDTAYKADQLNDPSSCLTFLEYEKKHYLIDIFNQRLEYPDLKRAVISQANLYKPDVILIEDKASGQSLIQELNKETNLSIKAIKPEGDKLTRLSTVSHLIENGKLFLPEKHKLLFDFTSQLLSFPNSSHDDMVDSLSQYFKYVQNYSVANIRFL